MASYTNHQATYARSVPRENINIQGQIIYKGGIPASAETFNHCPRKPRLIHYVRRHVRVNHIDKDTNDPQLREVLAQRCEGGNRGRRRRLGS